jgi:biotin transport system substrate-specific component
MSSTPGIPEVGSHSQSKAHPVLLNAVIVLCASLFVAACAHISIPLWFTPVPLTLQTFAVLLVGLILGGRRGFAALLLYLAEGAAGLPVFSPLGPGGLAQLVGPTGGYLMVYPVAAFVAGYASERWRGEKRLASSLDVVFGALTGDLIILLGGALWFRMLTHYAAPIVFKMTVLPFLPGEAIKIAFASAFAIQWGRFRKR